MTVTYDYYRIFYYVAKYRSFTRAAVMLRNSQPNITRAMNNLEQELGCRLFHRSNRGVTLTPEGERLFAHVQIAQEQLQAGEAELGSINSLQSGSVSIGVSEIALHSLLLPVLRDFKKNYPNIHIRITNHSTPQAISALKNGLVDLAVVTTPDETVNPSQKPLQEVRLIPFRDILIAGPSFSELTKRPLTLAELSRHPLIGLNQDTKTYDYYVRFFYNCGQVLEPDVEVATTDQILPMVKYNLGLGFVPRSFAADALEKGEVFEIQLSEKMPLRYVCLILDKSRPLSAAAQELEKRIRAAAPSEIR